MHRLALRRPLSTLLAAATLCVVGVFSLLQLPVALLPDLERPRVVITARAADASREQLLHGLTIPLERRLSALRGISSMRSVTEDERVRIELETEWQTDADRLRIEVARRVEGAGTIRVDELQVGVTSSERTPIVDVAVTGGAMGAIRTAFAEKVLVPELARIPGAGRIEIYGSTPRRVIVRPSAAQLAARGLTAEDVRQRLESVGRAMAAGRVRDGAVERPMVIVESIASLDELRALPVASGSLLGDVAAVSIEQVGDGTGFRAGAHDAVLLRVYRAPGSNAVALARGVAERIAETNTSPGSGVRADVIADRSREIVRAVGELGFAAVAGVLLATLLLRFILGHWRPTLALSTVVPASLLVAFAVFFFSGIPIDVVSLAGLALATGLLIDNSIVVLEAIETARQRGDRDPAASGTGQIVTAVVASTVTLLIVFIPLLYLRGLARAFFGEQAVSIIASLAASLLFSLTLTPVLARRAVAATGRNPGYETYARVLGSGLRRPALVAAAGIALSIAICAGGLLLKRELLPAGEANAVTLRLRFPPDLAREELARRVAAIEQRVMRAAEPFEPAAFRSIRGLRDATGEPTATAEITIGGADETSALLTAIRREMEGVPDVRFDLAPRASLFAEAIGDIEQRAEIVLSAATAGDAERLARGAASAIEAKSGVRPEAGDEERTRRALAVVWNEPLVERMQLDRAAAERQIRAATGEIDAGRVDIAAVEPAIRLAPAAPDLKHFPIRAPSGRVVLLGALAESVPRTREAALVRENGRPARRLLVDLPSGIDAAAVLRIADGERRGEGDRVRLAGSALELARSFAQLRFAFLLSVVLMFLVLAAVYESLRLPLIVIASVPVAMAGGIAALALTGQSLNLMSFIGLIFLGGIVVNHTVVFVDRIEQLRRDGVDERDAVLGAARERYRPILLTTVTAILGMLPLALIGGEGVELRRSLATAIVGGLITSMYASLVLVPLLHLLVARRPAVEPAAPSPALEPISS